MYSEALYDMSPISSKTGSKQTVQNKLTVYCTNYILIFKKIVLISFSSQAPKHWNSLPIELKTCSSLDKFKKDLKTFLFSYHYHGYL